MKSKRLKASLKTLHGPTVWWWELSIEPRQPLLSADIYHGTKDEAVKAAKDAAKKLNLEIVPAKGEGWRQLRCVRKNGLSRLNG